ncbi:Uncharacterized protein TCAP_04605 [Tolypocladium capitatum]|uniref:Altered inheritance of mitochondria protein 21 n=1 Tax=Tolypocladium capitatum TaxID=45235 RepID=A0A2K3QD32_9HYPO|nr:Uncharacterized protein TCAP_04605 [Tolypocladium capitatum]
MSAAAMQETPAVPPRPSRATDKEASAAPMPKVPPRPVNKRRDRSISPNPDRFARSPLNGGIVPKDPRATYLSQHYTHKQQYDDTVERSGSVPMPSVGEEGMEYSAVADELKHDEQRSSLPEQTRTVADDLKLHAPKPSLPAVSAKKQVMAVTRTDSDKAASFGIGQPSTAEERAVSRNSNKKRPSSSISAYSDHQTDDEHGIPEIGQRVPMNRHLGDVQAPSPGPGPEGTKKHHGRKLSARGLPPGSYGLHGHGATAQDKLDKAYYQKHPEVLEREQHTPLHDRQNDFAMSSSDLNRLVRDTANLKAALGASELRGTPTDEVAFQATEEYTSRISSSRPASAAAKGGSGIVSPQNDWLRPDVTSSDVDTPIHVDDPRHPEYYSCGNENDATVEDEEEYNVPILAQDEVKREPIRVQQPAIRPHPERRGNSFDGEDPPSRPTSRPGSIRITHTQPEYGSTPLEDVEEYEPLFSEEAKEEKPKQEMTDENECRRHFPSKDIWEDAPSSVHYTTTVLTPEEPEQNRRRSSAYNDDRPITPAQAFAQYQEQLAEKEASGRTNNFLPLSEEKPTWIGHQPHLQAKRPAASKRFPSRDVWEDAPESHLHEAALSGSPTEEEEEEDKPEIPARPVKKASPSSAPPVLADRPKARQSSGDDSVKQRPPLSDKPKPQIPPRPAKSTSGDSKDGAFSKPKPPVPSRPVGNKIAALQAGFMSDLNKRLQLGPQAPKKEDVAKEEETVEEKEKTPLSDARKSRARGPQRRAPAKSPALVVAAGNAPALTLTFFAPHTSWAIDPDYGDVAVSAETEAAPESETKAEVPHSTILEKAQERGESTKTGLLEEPVAIEASSEAGKTEEAELREKLVQTAQKDKTKESEDAEEELVKGEKTLASNRAGESVLEATVKREPDGNEVEPVEVHEDAKA